METIIILALITGLGSPDYSIRAGCHSKLELHLESCYKLLFYAEKKYSQKPEVCTRVGILLDVWAATKSKSMRPAGYQWVPWIDSIPHGYHDRSILIAKYLALVDSTSSDKEVGPPYWSKYRNATILYLKDMLRSGIDPIYIQELLDSMVICEKQWIVDHQYGFKFDQDQLEAAGVKPCQ